MPESVPCDRSFAVIRMDPVAMVRHFNDPVALRAAEAISPKTYLVYLYEYCPLPIRDTPPWYGYDIYPIGPCLRPANEDECITADMCTPIWPNQVHPEGRTPLRTEPPFPFDNCYFWFDTGTKIRVCPRGEGFHWDQVTELWPVREYTQWQDYEEQDELRQIRARQARAPSLPEPIPENCAPNSVPQRSLTPISRYPDVGELQAMASPCVEDDARSANSVSVYSGSIIASTDVTRSDDTFTIMERLFSDPEESPELHPLCHLWFDLAANIKQDEIPSPVHFFKERDAIVKIIREARARNPDLPPLPMPSGSELGSTESLECHEQEQYLNPDHPDVPPSLVHSNSHGGSDSSAQSPIRGSWSQNSEPLAEPETRTNARRFRPFNSLYRVLRRVRGLFRIPYVPVWP